MSTIVPTQVPERARDRRRSTPRSPRPSRCLRVSSRRRRPGCHRGLRDRGPPCDRGAPAPDPSPVDVATPSTLGPQSSIDSLLQVLLPRGPARERGQRAARGAQRDRRFESKESATSVAPRRGRRAPVVPGRLAVLSQWASSTGLSQRACAPWPPPRSLARLQRRLHPPVGHVLVHQAHELLFGKRGEPLDQQQFHSCTRFSASATRSSPTAARRPADSGLFSFHFPPRSTLKRTSPAVSEEGRLRRAGVSRPLLLVPGDDSGSPTRSLSGVYFGATVRISTTLRTSLRCASG